MRFSIDDLLKRPNIYFVILLAVSFVWMVVVSFIMLPAAVSDQTKKISNSKQVSEYCDQIFQLDPARLNYTEIRNDVGRFSYTSAVDKIAGKHGIRPSDYDIRTEQVRKYRGNQTQGATVTIKEVSIKNVAGFLSELLEIWPDLECENIKLTSNKDKPDDWKITIKFTYKLS
ncbi:MAG: hypothetical protein ACIAQZ_07300 [Sedimentisphaeraceae bacterium JB056]